MKSRYQKARKWLIFWTLFIGLGAVAGSIGMLADPTGKAMGMDAMLPYFQVLPFADILFQNFVFSGIMLLIVNGLPNLIAAGLLLKNKKSGIILGGIFGVSLMLWICIQFYMFPLNFMSTIYFIFGLCQAITGYAARVFYNQESFTVKIEDYPKIGSNEKQLVVFFSRMGYVKRIAYEEANRTGAVIFEIKSTEKTEGTGGFWWCGRYGLHRWEMPIEPINLDLSRFDHVTICSPVWVFALSGPLRTFCAQEKGKITEADLMTVHFQKMKYAQVRNEAEQLLDLKFTNYRSICCKRGDFK